MAEGTTQNVVVARRLAFIKRDGKALAQKYLDSKITLAEIAEKFEISEVQALYGIRQHAVEHGLVNSMTLNADDQKAVQSAHGEGEYADWAWLACRAGVTPQRLQKAVKGEVSVPPAPRTRQGSGSKSRRTVKAQKETANA